MGDELSFMSLTTWETEATVERGVWGEASLMGALKRSLWVDPTPRKGVSVSGGLSLDLRGRGIRWANLGTERDIVVFVICDELWMWILRMRWEKEKGYWMKVCVWEREKGRRQRGKETWKSPSSSSSHQTQWMTNTFHSSPMLLFHVVSFNSYTNREGTHGRHQYSTTFSHKYIPCSTNSLPISSLPWAHFSSCS